MQDLLFQQMHDLGARRIHWRYDDPSGVPDVPVRSAGTPVRAAGELRRVRRQMSPKAA
jgi:hypothetical protein